MILSTTEGSESCKCAVSPTPPPRGTRHRAAAQQPPPRGIIALTVDVSPNWSSSPAKIFRMMRRMILPDLVLGRSGTTKMAFGAANGPIDLRTCVTKSFFTWSDDSTPSLSATKAFTAWPVNSSLMPTTAASPTWSAQVVSNGGVNTIGASRSHTVLDERCLNFCSGQSVARDVDDIVDAASDPVVAFVVTSCTVSSELV